jgi:hypothetical protein
MEEKLSLDTILANIDNRKFVYYRRNYDWSIVITPVPVVHQRDVNQLIGWAKWAKKQLTALGYSNETKTENKEEKIL